MELVIPHPSIAVPSAVSYSDRDWLNAVPERVHVKGGILSAGYSLRMLTSLILIGPRHHQR
jgi:hypothetical protein